MCQSNCIRLVLLISVLSVNAMPWDELMEEKRDDTAVVESTVREARAIPEEIDDLLKPGIKNAFLHTYGDKQGEEGNLLGYSKKMNDKGNDGYQHADGFHKKDSDKYGYEFHTEFGQENKAKLEVADKNDDESSKEDNTSKADNAEESKKSYEVVETVDDNNKKYAAAIEDFDFGYYADSGEGKESAPYTDDSNQGKDKESESYSEETSGEENTPHPNENEKYSSGESSSYSHSSDGDDADDGNSKSSYTAEESEEEEDY